MESIAYEREMWRIRKIGCFPGNYIRIGEILHEQTGVCRDIYYRPKDLLVSIFTWHYT